MRTVHIETELPTSAEQVWQAMRHPASFSYVTRGVLGVPPLAGRTEPYHHGELATVRLWLFHLLPLWRHTIELVEVDPATHVLRSREHGGVLAAWHHTLRVEPVGERRCRYSDTVDIDAGRLTPLVAVAATLLYRYRQRRWHTLVRNHLLPTGPRYPRTP